jgi:hypothetical protein
MNEMVQGPCAHVVLHLCWFHRFINSYWVYIIRHQTQHSRLYYIIFTKFQVNCPRVYKTCPLTDPDELWPLWHWKVGQIRNPGIMSCILTRCTNDKNLEMIQPLVQDFLRFRFWPLVAKPRIRSDRNTVISPWGTDVQSFRSIDPAVTKRALLTDDDDDGRRTTRHCKSSHVS